MHITKIETVYLNDLERERHRNLWIQLYTDTGLVGLGETQSMPAALAELVHDMVPPLLLGRDPTDVEYIWADLYSAAHFYGGAGAEMRAISAIDIALWDIVGQAVGQPIYKVLGGQCRDRIRVYNTCISAGKMRDHEAFLSDAGDLARDLAGQGFTAMKIWPWDIVAPRAPRRVAEKQEVTNVWIRNANAPGAIGLVGQYISPDDLERGLAPVRKIREAVGDHIDIAIEGHARWNLPTAIKIARALEPYNIMWLEDIMPVDNVDDLARLVRETRVPICVSERLVTRWGFRQVLEKGAAHVIMPDLTWCGGLTEIKKIAALAEMYHLPIAPHGATGPVLTIASAHACATLPNAMALEVVRSHYQTWFSDIVTKNVSIREGYMELPTGPGLGTALRPEVLRRPDAVVRVSQ